MCLYVEILHYRVVCKLGRFQYKILWGMVVKIFHTDISLFKCLTWRSTIVMVKDSNIVVTQFVLHLFAYFFLDNDYLFSFR